MPDGIATSPGTSADGSQIYVMRSDEAEARRLIASPDGDDRPVDREVAEEIIYRLCVLQQTLSRPLVVPFDEEFPRLAELQGIVGDAIGCIHTDVMMPFIEQYPDLDPDRGGLQRPADSSAGLEGEIDDARFATAFRHAAGAALRDLDALSRFVESREGTQAQVRFDADCDRSRQAIRRLLQRAKDVLRA